MTSAHEFPREHLVRLACETLSSVHPGASELDATTPLVGARAILDSVGLVTFLVSLEERLENRVDLASSFMEEGDLDDETNPFRTVGSLVDHVRALLFAAA